MSISLPPQLIALGAALSYAISGIAARRGMRDSTPITLTLVSVAVACCDPLGGGASDGRGCLRTPEFFTSPRRADNRWNTLDRGRNNLDLLAARKSASLISLVAPRLSVGRRFSSWHQPSAATLCYESGRRTALSCRYHWNRRAALVGELHSFADQGQPAGLEPTIDGLVFDGRCF